MSRYTTNPGERSDHVSTSVSYHKCFLLLIDFDVSSVDSLYLMYKLVAGELPPYDPLIQMLLHRALEMSRFHRIMIRRQRVCVGIKAVRYQESQQARHFFQHNGQKNVSRGKQMYWHRFH